MVLFAFFVINEMTEKEKNEIDLNLIIRFYSLLDRLILKKKILEHFLRGLAEKQALIKFFYLTSEKGKSFNESFISHPLYVGNFLLHAENENILEKIEFSKLIEDQQDLTRYFIPYLLNYIQVINIDKRDASVTNISYYYARACNLNALPDQKVVEEPIGAKMFEYHHLHCKSFIPVEFIQYETLSNPDNKTNAFFSTLELTAIQYWFNLIELSPDQKGLIKGILQKEKLERLPFYLIIYMMNMTLVYKKISPHITLPYHIHSAIEDIPVVHPPTTTPPTTVPTTKEVRKKTTIYIATESPEVLLKEFASLPTEIGKNIHLREHWEQTDKKTIDQLLTIIWSVAYTMYIYALLGIYEKPFLNESMGIDWVEKNIRAFKMEQGIGYWTYLLSALPNDIPAIKKYIPNMGYFWTISDFGIFQSAFMKSREEELKEEMYIQGQGILYYVVMCLISQVNTWFRRIKRTTTEQPNEVPTFLPSTSSTIQNIELELSDFSVYDMLDNSEILHRLEDLKITLDNYRTYQDPETYRKFLHHTIFSSWNVKPGYSLATRRQYQYQQQQQQQQDESKSFQQQQENIGFTFSDYEKNCNLQSQLHSSFSNPIHRSSNKINLSYLDNIELDVFGWNSTNVLSLPYGLFENKICQVDKVYQHIFPISPNIEFIDFQQQDILIDAQKKAFRVHRVKAFWDILRTTSHLYLRDDYETLQKEQGMEQWNPTIPRHGMIQSVEDCFIYGYTVMSVSEKENYYEFLERELISRYFQIDLTNVSQESVELYHLISNSITKHGVKFLETLQERIESLSAESHVKPEEEAIDASGAAVVVGSESMDKEKKLPLLSMYPSNISFQTMRDLSIELDKEFKEEEESKSTKLPPDLLQIEEFLLKNVSQQTSTELVKVEKLEEIYPIILRIIALLPEFYRMQARKINYEKITQQDLKRNTQKRVLDIQRFLQAEKYNEIVHDYPVPSGRRKLLSFEEERKEIENKKKSKFQLTEEKKQVSSTLATISTPVQKVMLKEPKEEEQEEEEPVLPASSLPTPLTLPFSYSQDIPFSEQEQEQKQKPKQEKEEEESKEITETPLIQKTLKHPSIKKTKFKFEEKKKKKNQKKLYPFQKLYLQKYPLHDLKNM